jgi:phenylalanyl-tRNA synthetase beta chain
LCRAVELFDVYRGEPLEAGRKSLAFEVVLQSGERTLTDEDVKAAVDAAVASAAELGATLRG